jgi:CheY-like chemotaxis protein
MLVCCASEATRSQVVRGRYSAFSFHRPSASSLCVSSSVTRQRLCYIVAVFSASFRCSTRRFLAKVDGLQFATCRAQTMLSASTSVERPLILCINDNKSQLWLRTQTLEKAGYAVLSATNADRAVRLLRDNTVHLILSDHMLSGRAGTQLTVRLKKLGPHIPILLYSDTPPTTMQHVDCFVDQHEPVRKFLSIIRDLINRYCN